MCAVSYQGLDVPNAKSTSINGLNNSQTMVGSFADKNNAQHGFIYSNQQFTTVDGPASGQTTSGGGADTELNAISNNGIVAGDDRVVISGASGTYAQAFTYQNGVFHVLQVSASNAIPTGVNSSGVVVGIGDLVGCCNVSWIHNPDGSSSNFFENNGMNSGAPEGITDNGVIVGDAGPFIFTPNFTPPPYPNPTTSANGTFAHFTVTGVSGVSTQGINGSQQVVGYYGVPGSTNNLGFEKTGSNYCSLSVPGAKSTMAADINDSGMIVGRYTDAAGVQHGFIAH